MKNRIIATYNPENKIVTFIDEHSNIDQYRHDSFGVFWYSGRPVGDDAKVLHLNIIVDHCKRFDFPYLWLSNESEEDGSMLSQMDYYVHLGIEQPETIIMSFMSGSEYLSEILDIYNSAMSDKKHLANY